MAETNTHSKSDIIALLCVGDLAMQKDGAPTPLTPLYGQPLIHHLIKDLEKAGISKFCIGVDNVPGALLHYRDEAVAKGLDIQFVRDPSALSSHYGKNIRVLVFSADTICAPQLLSDILEQPGAFIATVEEQPENQAFERIDLNNRWSGLAVLGATTLEAMVQMPDGWDMASALLRQAVQDGVTLKPIRQAELQSGNLKKLAQADDLIGINRPAKVSASDRKQTLESFLFAYPVGKILPYIWTVSWGRLLANWLFPFSAGCALLLAAVSAPIPASVAAVFASFCATLRRAVRLAEYQPDKPDVVDIFSWIILASSMFINLYLAQFALVDAGFLTLTLVGLSLLFKGAQGRAGFIVLSPLPLALGMLLGSFMGAPDFTAKLFILAAIFSQIGRALSGDTKSKAVD